MNMFQTVVSVIAIVVLIICLIIVGHALYNHKFNTAYPPVVEDCPDYWLDMSNGDASNCINIKNLGSCSDPMDFSGYIWQGSKGLCNKYHWAKKCGVKWDGVTNTNDACSRDSGSSDDSGGGGCPICPSVEATVSKN